mgnify:CR=1 FL=1
MRFIQTSFHIQKARLLIINGVDVVLAPKVGAPFSISLLIMLEKDILR